MLIRQGVPPQMGNGRSRLIGGRRRLPKGVFITLDAGWTTAKGTTFLFTAPPGLADAALSFNGLTIGEQYRLTFAALSPSNYGTMAFRPGVIGLETFINVDGAYSIDFTAAETDGLPKIFSSDVLGGVEVNIINLRLVAI